MYRLIPDNQLLIKGREVSAPGCMLPVYANAYR
jgi:hypothetical protein